MEISKLINQNSTIVEKALDSYMKINGYGIEDSMRYSLLAGGKRIRPFIVLETYKLFSKSMDIQKAIPFACALEMIHTYSLIHDDLPCMDNDDYRRGKPTNHKVYGETTALLAGDSLLTYAFDVASSNQFVSDKSIVYAIKALSQCAGYSGMIGGQVIDLGDHSNLDTYEKLENMQSLKTGALIRCAALLGYYAYTDNPKKNIIDDLNKFANNIGIAFQIRDDILDKIADEAELGKPTGSDEKNNKITVLSYMSIDEAQNLVNKLTQEAISIINKYSYDEYSSLSELAKYLVERKK